MSELVSVIVPVYNVEKYLVKCVQSILDQTYKKIEVILVDDGSPDQCPQICDAFAQKDNRVKVLHQSNGGQGKARNAALQICHGQYVSFLDSDDVWEADYVEKLLQAILENKADIAICNYNHINEQGEKILNSPKTKIKRKIYTGQEAMEVALYWNEFGVAPWAKLYKKTLWESVSFKTDRIYEDLATTYLVYHAANRVVFINEYLMNYRIRANSDIHQAFNEKKVRILDSADDILMFCKKNAQHSLKAAKSRQLASASFVYYRIPDEELERYMEVVKRCKKIIKKYRFGVMLDVHARRKTRLGAAVSYIGFGTSRKIFQKFVVKE